MSKTTSAGTTSAATTTYSYDTGNAAAYLQHDLLVLDPPGNQSANETVNQFDPSGRVTNQVTSGGVVYTFAYSGSSYATDNESSNGGTTTLTKFPFGTGSGEPSTVDVYSYQYGVLRSDGVEQRRPGRKPEGL